MNDERGMMSIKEDVHPSPFTLPRSSFIVVPQRKPQCEGRPNAEATVYADLSTAPMEQGADPPEAEPELAVRRAGGD